MKHFVLILLLSLAHPGPVAAAEQSPQVDLRLSDAISMSLKSSPRLQSALYEQSSAQNRADSQHSTFFPRLSLDASFRYVTQVPSLNLPSRVTLPFGDHQSYSVGPLLTWTLFDSSMSSNVEKSLREQEKSKRADYDLVKRQVTLGVRLAYFRILQASEEMKLVVNSLKLVQAQYLDIRTRNRVGSASKTDALSAHREVLEYQIQFQTRQSELSAALQDFFEFTGQSQEFDLSRPMNSQSQLSPLDEMGAPSVSIKAEPIDSVLKELSGLDEGHTPEENHPQLQALAYMTQAFSHAADSSAAGHWPKVQVFAKSSFDYPNGPVLEPIQQNAVGVTASWSLFEFGRIKSEVAEKRNLAAASESRREQAKRDLIRDWRNSKNLLNSLRAQKTLNKTSAEEAENIAKLVYSSYRVGRSTFLEVETANLHSHEAKIKATRNEIRILVQMATLAFLSEDN